MSTHHPVKFASCRMPPVFSFGALTALLLVSCERAPTSEVPPPPSVTVAQPLQKQITEWDEFTGRFAAVETVEIRARVSGYVNSVHFKDGQLVNKGDLLFVIDPRPYEIAVEQAKAEVQRAKARLEIAAADVDRAAPLAKSQTLTQREFETRLATQREAAGAVASLELNFLGTYARPGSLPLTARKSSGARSEKSK
jgi:membrane fusion protein, multidrug efflux system